VRLSGDVAEPLRRFSAPEKAQLTGEIIVGYIRVRHRLRTLEFPRAVASIRGETPTAQTGSHEAMLLGVRLGLVIERVFRVIPGDTRCLTRSLVLLRMLSRRGIASSVVLGVRAAPEFGAHAWVEHAGQPLLPPIESSGRQLLVL
jgi:hypothetical protein